MVVREKVKVRKVTKSVKSWQEEREDQSQCHQRLALREQGMAVEENLNKSMYKLLILMLKYIPMLISLVYVLNTALSYFYIDIPVLSNLAGMSILPWIFMYLSATVFRFCLYHKMFLHYILVTDIINIIDYYVGIPIEDLELLMIHGTITGLFLFVMRK